MIRKWILLLMAVMLPLLSAHAVLKERDLKQTLTILRSELEKVHTEQERNVRRAQERQERTRREFMQTMQRSN